MRAKPSRLSAFVQMILDSQTMPLTMISLPIAWPTAAIAAWGDRWLVAELSLFGSVLR